MRAKMKKQIFFIPRSFALLMLILIFFIGWPQESYGMKRANEIVEAVGPAVALTTIGSVLGPPGAAVGLLSGTIIGPFLRHARKEEEKRNQHERDNYETCIAGKHDLIIKAPKIRNFNWNKEIEFTSKQINQLFPAFRKKLSSPAYNGKWVELTAYEAHQQRIDNPDLKNAINLLNDPLFKDLFRYLGRICVLAAKEPKTNHGEEALRLTMANVLDSTINAYTSPLIEKLNTAETKLNTANAKLAEYEKIKEDNTAAVSSLSKNINDYLGTLRKKMGSTINAENGRPEELADADYRQLIQKVRDNPPPDQIQAHENLLRHQDLNPMCELLLKTALSNPEQFKNLLITWGAHLRYVTAIAFASFLMERLNEANAKLNTAEAKLNTANAKLAAMTEADADKYLKINELNDIIDRAQANLDAENKIYYSPFEYRAQYLPKEIKKAQEDHNQQKKEKDLKINELNESIRKAQIELKAQEVQVTQLDIALDYARKEKQTAQAGASRKLAEKDLKINELNESIEGTLNATAALLGKRDAKIRRKKTRIEELERSAEETSEQIKKAQAALDAENARAKSLSEKFKNEQADHSQQEEKYKDLLVQADQEKKLLKARIEGLEKGAQEAFEINRKEREENELLKAKILAAEALVQKLSYANAVKKNLPQQKKI